MLQLFAPITKINEATREVDVCITSETLDKSKEIFDYESSKPHVQAWSDEILKATSGIDGVSPSLGNVRSMHSKNVAGKFTALSFDDAAKSIGGTIKVLDDNDWHKLTEGGYTGVSIGGDYVKKWDDPTIKGAKRYTAKLSEVSLVDSPCNPGARFLAVRKDGTEEFRKFTSVKTPAQFWGCDVVDHRHVAKADALACEGEPVEKYNENHDDKGQFSTDGGGSGSLATSAAGRAAEMASTPGEHRAAASYHAQKEKEMQQRGNKNAAKLHDKAAGAHLTAHETNTPLATMKAGIMSDAAHDAESRSRKNAATDGLEKVDTMTECVCCANDDDNAECGCPTKDKMAQGACQCGPDCTDCKGQQCAGMAGMSGKATSSEMQKLVDDIDAIKKSIESLRVPQGNGSRSTTEEHMEPAKVETPPAPIVPELAKADPLTKALDGVTAALEEIKKDNAKRDEAIEVLIKYVGNLPGPARGALRLVKKEEDVDAEGKPVTKAITDPMELMKLEIASGAKPR